MNPWLCLRCFLLLLRHWLWLAGVPFHDRSSGTWLELGPQKQMCLFYFLMRENETNAFEQGQTLQKKL